jgi:RHS repeat-associated protein
MTEEKNTATTETKKFFYNSENRMVRYEHYPTDIDPPDIVAEYKYDIYGRRIQKSVNGAVTNFLWEGDNLAYELDLNYQPIRRYVYGIGKDDLKGHVEFAEASSDVFNPAAMAGWYSYIKDQVGTINQVYSHQSAGVVDIRTYDVFGKLFNQSGTSNGNMGFQSKYYDSETGLNYYYHRYYYPQVGRFINEDPIGFRGGVNFYQFGGYNPINFVDLYGLEDDFLWGRLRGYQDLSNFDPTDGANGVDVTIDMMNDVNEGLLKYFIYQVENCYYVCFWGCMIQEGAIDSFLKNLEEKVYIRVVDMNKRAGRRILAKIVRKVINVISKLEKVSTAIDAYICHQKCKHMLPKIF